MTRFSDLLRGLSEAQVEFILIGGVAALAAGPNFTLVTSPGWIDLLGEVTGGGRWFSTSVPSFARSAPRAGRSNPKR